jgi:hypothetical protein
MSAYCDDMRRAWTRINSFRPRRLRTPLGTIEYADQGKRSAFARLPRVRMPYRHRP